MKLDRFRGSSVGEALSAVRRELGEDALVLRTRVRPGEVEVMATTAMELYQFGAGVRSLGSPRPSGRRSLVIGLVGPTGSGKTTTLAKLALSERGFAGGRVGIISLDTHKIGAFDQIQTYADLADLSLDVVSNPSEANRALRRLRSCDVVLVDTPGRSPRADGSDRDWWNAFGALAADEVHFVIPATIQGDVARALLRHHAKLAPSHILMTKLDEVPAEEGVAELTYSLGLPARWATDGQVVPDDLHAAPDRLLASLLGRSPNTWVLEATA